MLSFTAEDHDRVIRGEITITWRLWKYAHVKAGRAYSTGFGYVDIEDVRLVPAKDVTEADAHEVGLPDVQALFDLVRSHTGAEVSPETVLYRVQFRYRPEPPPRPVLGLDEIRARLARLDRASPRGAWTEATLRAIEENPGVAARHLAAAIDMETLPFKVNVRKLKALGLTLSLGTGYELTELGQAYLDSSRE